MRVLGAILAGGESRRFGSDKALAELAGMPLIDHVRRALAPQVDTVVVIGRAWPGSPVLADRPAPGLGPLGGLAAALHHARAGGYAWVLSAPCDVPRLPGGLRALLEDAGEPAALAECPVIGLWPATLGEALDRHMAAGGTRSMRGWLAACGGRLVATGPIANVNRPQDLAALGRPEVGEGAAERG